ncbi:hypothetical protein [Pantoea phytobeneficialis]|uniref:Uncharacterized protein n=1 Tax=Pantoea phytobeneficialis TaxID=2052056 RepID=A0AAP9H4K2_9GAMM|nr:hypothetical protein [Pantoea phytobeneficialis]MDO6406293.1 hypothetical protein [Pantoea phytobeneficialis]QGR06219.1 hypothetical protein CTZ24_07270 [Pantoea phytobeneficialis]
MERTSKGEIIIGPILDLRLKPGMERVRNGRVQQFGPRIVRAGKEIQPCDFSLQPAEKHHYALEIEGKWMWVNGCGHCNQNGEKMSYVVCDEHDRCQSCRVKREDATTIPPRNEWDSGGGVWGSKDENGVWGFTCHACHAAQEAEKRAEALARIVPDEDYDEWDFYSEDTAKCPWCSAKICTEESYDADGESHECVECGRSFSLTAEHSVSWTTKRVEGGSHD